MKYKIAPGTGEVKAVLFPRYMRFNECIIVLNKETQYCYGMFKLTENGLWDCHNKEYNNDIFIELLNNKARFIQVKSYVKRKYKKSQHLSAIFNLRKNEIFRIVYSDKERATEEYIFFDNKLLSISRNKPVSEDKIDDLLMKRASIRKERFMPELSYGYFYYDFGTNEIEHAVWSDSDIDYARYLTGNVFETTSRIKVKTAHIAGERMRLTKTIIAICGRDAFECL